MKRVTALKVLAGALVVLMVVSAYPLSGIVVDQFASTDATVPASRAESPTAGNVDLPFPDGADPGSPGTSAPGTDGASSRPATSFNFAATGSALLDQVLGASALLGHQVALPNLPLQKLAPENPLRHAILGWILVTNSDVPAEELAVELARADALPEDLQRNLAILVISASEATLLQQEALAKISPEDLAWIQANPDVADALVNGANTPETNRLASLAALVDIEKSVQASLLLLQAVEVTRAPLAKYDTQSLEIPGLADINLDANTRAILDRLAGPTGASAAEKVAFAADLVALTAGLPIEREALPEVTFTQGIQFLLASTSQPVDALELDRVIRTADALPEDLSKALGKVLYAQARAVAAANPDVLTSEGQARALVDVLDATAAALPTLEKYSLFWAAAPDAMRVGQWDTASRLQWAAETGGLLASAQANPLEAVRAAGTLLGAPVITPTFTKLTFIDAVEAGFLRHGVAFTPEARGQAQRAADTLTPAVRDAAALMLSGALEADRLNAHAFSALTPEERAFLLSSTDVDALYFKTDLTADELARLARFVTLSERVDVASIVAAGIVSVDSTLGARDILQAKAVYATQGTAHPRATGWRAVLASLLPFGSARAQSASDLCTPIVDGSFRADCDRDILLTIDFGGNGGPLLTITGEKGSTHYPGTYEADVVCTEKDDWYRFEGFNGVYTYTCRATYYQLGAPTVSIDLGGDDTYLGPVALTLPTPYGSSAGLDSETGSISIGEDTAYLVSLHLDLSGSDTYLDPTPLYSNHPDYHEYYGENRPIPTQASAYGGGTAVLLDVDGTDTYEAESRSQGYGRFGFAALVDLNGGDTYAGKRFVQGASSEGMTPSIGMLIDARGGDTYIADAGMGYGYGGILLDLEGKDTYMGTEAAKGVPMLHLDIIPGGELVTLNSRGDDRMWLDGPAGINIGIAIDREANQQSAADTDGDGDRDIVEFLSGSDPNDPYDNAEAGRARRLAAIVDDSDLDGYPNSVERALSTNPNDPKSYPAGFPGALTPPQSGDRAVPSGGDKIFDLRLPVQKAGSIEADCVYRAFNASTPYTPAGDSYHTPESKKPDATCVHLAYDSNGQGQGNLTIPSTEYREKGGTSYAYDFPLGIFALGDTIATKYDIDYFVAIDLGGADTWRNRAGGALPMAFQQKGSTPGPTVLAPSLALSIDNTGAINDVYTAPVGPKGDYVQGSLMGVLIDTAGDDRYTAGDASQGALGGILLDFAGKDIYKAGSLSQGAALDAPAGSEDAGRGIPAEGRPVSKDAPVRRAAPGLLADYGTDNDSYSAMSHSQGSGRGFDVNAGNAAESTPYATGILFDAGGFDRYTVGTGAIHAQGVGSARSLGLLYDRSGNDTYTAWGVVSQGATTSQTYREPATSAARSGAGILFDTGGSDVYTYIDATGAHERTSARRDNVTISHGNAVNSSYTRVYGDVGLHIDGEESSMANMLAGTGGSSATSDTQGNFTVNIPSARFAIGSEDDTTYTREYAFVVDLGGRNAYNYSAGGFVRDVIAESRQTPAKSVTGELITVSAYPVSFLYDAGTQASRYTARNALSQGAGFFTVGVLIDAGGNDVFDVLDQTLPSMGSGWMASSPIIDGTIGANEWKAARSVPLTLTGTNDTRFTQEAVLRIGNDHNNLYIALEIPTATVGAERVFDWLTLDLDTNRDRSAIGPNGFTGLDEIQARPTTPCTSSDRYYSASSKTIVTDVRIDAVLDQPNGNDITLACALPSAGGIIYEIVKPLQVTFPVDPADLAVRYDETLGLLDLELGLRVATTEKLSGESFTWPPMTTNVDGQLGFTENGDLADELAAWGALRLANKGVSAEAPVATRTSAISQGAGVGGVGILAMLGNAGSNAVLNASERAQGYGAYGGIGLLLDAGGSDTYRASRMAQGAADAYGVGILYELEGNDNYLAPTKSVGFGVGQGASAYFYDLSGSDEYRNLGVAAQNIRTETYYDSKTEGDYPPGNQRIWTQGTSSIGIDAASDDAFRNIVNTARGQLFGVPQTTLTVTRYSTVTESCTSTPVPATTDGPARDTLTGKVCLNARVQLAPTAPGGPATHVDSVDFLVDGIRVPGIPAASVTQHDGTFVLPLDASTIEDGVSIITAVASIRADTTPTATVYKDSAGAAKRTVYVNNAPRLALGVTPTFSGVADAAFSPNSALAGRTLDIAWNVSHDAKEDRLELYQGWSAPAENLNAPCSATATTLCNVLPFYFTSDGGRLRTDPGNLAGPRAKPIGQGQSPFSGFTDPTLTYVDLDPVDTFKVFLANRASVASPGEKITTYVRIELLNADETPVLTETGSPVLVASKTFGPITPPAVSTSAASFAAARGSNAPDTSSFAEALCGAVGGCVAPKAAPAGEGGAIEKSDEWQNLVVPVTMQNVPGHLEIVDGKLRILAGHVLKIVVGSPNPSSGGASGAYYDNVAKPVQDTSTGNTIGDAAKNTTYSSVNQTNTIRNVEGFKPQSVFLYGNAGAPSRIEMRVPAEPATVANISFERIGSDATLEFLQPVTVEGDILGSPTSAGRRYTERESSFTGSLGTQAVQDGLYRVRLYATDASGLSVNTTKTFLLDGTPPTSRITTPSELGRPLLTASGAIPVRWSVDETSASSSGLATTYLFYRDGDSGAWTRVAKEFPSSVRAYDHAPGSGSVFSFMTISVDRAGNIETMDASAGTLEATLTAAAAKKTALGAGIGYQVVTIDRDVPLFGVPDAIGGRTLNYKGNDLMFVRAGAPVSFSVNAVDQGPTGIGSVNITFVYVNASTGEVTSRSTNLCTNSCVAPFVYNTWGTHNTDKTNFPDGVWAVIFDISDRAANRVQVSAGNVLLDSVAPTIEIVDVVYPPGQTAAKPGDRVSVRARITDGFGLDEKMSRLDMTGTAITDEGEITLRPIRVEGEILFEGSFTLAKTADRTSGVVTSAIVASDLAGNVATKTFPFVIDTVPSSIVPDSVRVTDITHNAFTLRWNTTAPTSGYVKFGPGPFEMRGKTPAATTYTKEHAVTVEDLGSSTRYFLRAVSTTPAGLVEETDTLDAVTTTALFLRTVSPAAGDAVSGLVPVRFEGGLLDSVDFVTYTLEVRNRAGSNYSFVTTSTTRGTEHALNFNSTRYLDGDAYEFRLTAEAGKERRDVTFGPFTSDNTAPRLTVITPTVATNKTTPTIFVEASDQLSGFPANAFALTIDNQSISALDLAPTTAGFNVKHVVTEALSPGPHTFSLRALDKAGNEMIETWTVAIDGDAPEITANPTSYDPGLAAARAGGLASLNVTVKDASGISLVEADTSSVSSQASTRLFRKTGTDFWVGTFPIISAAEQTTVDVSVKATDIAGNARTALASLTVDNIAPVAGDVVIRSTTHTGAVLGVTANEPVVLKVVARAGGEPQKVVETTALAHSPTITLSGLLPSRVYTYTLVIEDGAGNAAVDKTGTFSTSQDLVKPTEVKGLVITDLLNGTLRLNWQPAEDDVGVGQYRVYRSDDGVNFQPIAELAETMYEDRNLPLEHGYVYQIVAVDYGGNEGNVIETVRASATTVPQLATGAAAPTVGSSSTTFKYTIRYQSAGGVPPAYVRVLIDGAPQEMTLIGAPDYVNGAVYEFDTRLAPHKRDAPHTYAFEANDGRYTVRFPADGSNLRGPLVSGDLRADSGSIGVANFAQNVPLGGAAGALGAILVAALAVAFVVRKKKEGSK